MFAKQRFGAALKKQSFVRQLPCKDMYVKKYQLMMGGDERKEIMRKFISVWLYFVKIPGKCCVPCCRSNYKTETTLTTTFGFPKNEELKKKWISSINRKDFLPGSTAAVCINHFDEQHIIWEDRIPQKGGSTHTIERKRPRLVDGAFY
ncbi:hypothetical protein JTE90_011984 [Oedothorax gibbosus]|uniref:THAP-type domain-containing protein n=1 Tax=Oedothorax gibbosus TaxID=931172 RepID=A0AAV6TRH4_9ARAC|nr:hypothetical protein JTE90_011984 [Oedothorax gibbosus]